MCAITFSLRLKSGYRTQLPILARHIARHEFGHLLGLDSSTIRNKDNRGGLYEGHCANDCTMQQVMNVEQAYDRAQHLLRRPHAGFCGDCVEVLRRH